MRKHQHDEGHDRPRERWRKGGPGHGGPPGFSRHGGWGGGPPFGWPGFGGGRGFGGRGSGGGRAARGDVRASVLALLSEQPRHGYQIITEITERSGGAWTPSPGSVYPVLQQLQDEGLVRPEEADGRRVFHLTEAGEAYVKDHAEELNEPWAAVGGQPKPGVGEMFGVFKQVAVAAAQVAQTGGEVQVEQARALLAETRRNLYRILAEDEPAAEPKRTEG